MALNNTYFESNKLYEPLPIPEQPGYVPPVPPVPPEPGSGDTPVIPRPSFSGSVTINFYINSSDDDVLDKNISSRATKTVVIKEPVDILDFTIPFNDTSIGDVNYAYMEGRYYYCTPILEAGNLTSLHFRVDALMSWKDQLANISAIVDRTGSQFNTYLPDSEVKITSYNNIHRVESSGGFSMNLKYYLLTIGDSGSSGGE